MLSYHNSPGSYCPWMRLTEEKVRSSTRRDKFCLMPLQGTELPSLNFHCMHIAWCICNSSFVPLRGANWYRSPQLSSKVQEEITREALLKLEGYFLADGSTARLLVVAPVATLYSVRNLVPDGEHSSLFTSMRLLLYDLLISGKYSSKALWDCVGSQKQWRCFMSRQTNYLCALKDCRDSLSKSTTLLCYRARLGYEGNEPCRHA